MQKEKVVSHECYHIQGMQYTKCVTPTRAVASPKNAKWDVGCENRNWSRLLT